jgi:hypothetical protein
MTAMAPEARRMLGCKIAWNGGTLIVADRWFPTPWSSRQIPHRRQHPLLLGSDAYQARNSYSYGEGQGSGELSCGSVA